MVLTDGVRRPTVLLLRSSVALRNTVDQTLGPTRAKRAWAALGVDGHGLWDEAPSLDFVGVPRLTPRMTARIQGFSDH